MRQVLLAVMLMGAAFAGGAVMNGPGLRWVQENVFNKTGDEGEAAVPESAVQPVEASIPSAPVPSLGSETPTSDAAKSSEKTAAKSGDLSSEFIRKPAAPAVAENASNAADQSPPPADRGEPETPPKRSVSLALAEPPAPVAALPPLEAPVDTEAPRAKDTDMGAEPPAPKGQDSPHGPRPQASAERAGPWADAPDSAPAAAVPPKGYQRPAAGDSAVAPAAAGGGDWTALRRRMRELGVSRYGFDGEPNGRVRFHCVIPLAGRRAVGQQFEAEADDEFQAAQIALRRVALWQATEGQQ